jgi:hypothetical protein
MTIEPIRGKPLLPLSAWLAMLFASDLPDLIWN